MTSLCKLAAYGKETDGARTVCDRLVYRIKDRHVTNYERFLAKQLSPIVRAEITSRGWLARDGDGKLPFETVVTYCPRSPAMARSRGTDQAERVARNLAVELGLPFVRAFVHRAGGEQKGLRGQERQIRAQAAYRLRRGVSVTVRRVILVDDIVTSGATMAACTEALFSAGALSVIGVAAEYVVRKKEKKRKRT